MQTRNNIALKYRIAIFLLFAMASVTAMAQKTGQKTILFVCEHGSAKSVVAASHFSRLAEQHGLNINVSSRGLKPDEVVSEKVNQVLAQDGLPVHSQAPEKLTAKDVAEADYLVSFTPLPADLGQPRYLEVWNVPSFEEDYLAARDAIIAHIEKMIQYIQ